MGMGLRAHGVTRHRRGGRARIGAKHDGSHCFLSFEIIAVMARPAAVIARGYSALRAHAELLTCRRAFFALFIAAAAKGHCAMSRLELTT